VSAKSMGYGDRVDRPPSPMPGDGQSRITLPGRFSSRRAASGADWKTFSAIWTLDGGGADFVPDTIGYDVVVPGPATISEVRFWEANDAAASINFDIWRDKWDNGKPTIADTILPAPISVVGAARYRDRVLANWNRVVVGGDVLKLYVNSCALIKRGFVALVMERSI